MSWESFAPFGLEVLRQDWSTCPGVEQSARVFVERLPVWQKGTPFQAMHLVVDGSFFEAAPERLLGVRAGWAICVLVSVQNSWQWAGFLASHCAPAGCSASLGVAVTSAFQTELSALVYALALCLAPPVPAAIG